MARFQFSGQDGSFTLTDAENVTGLAFPIAGENGLKDCVTPNLGGDSKCDQNTFVLEPTSAHWCAQQFVCFCLLGGT